MSNSAESGTPVPTRVPITPLEVARAMVLAVALASLAIWGFTQFEFPMTLIVGIGAPVLTLVIWALFLSPRPVLRVHPFLAAVVELVIYVTVTMAWWHMQELWIGIGFAVVAIAAALVTGLRRLP